MITGKDVCTVLSALAPLYVAMLLGFGSVRWWKIFTPDQCSGINRFVAAIAFPALSFNFVASNNPYEMSLKFLAGDSLQKVVILALLILWSATRFGSVDWAITLFSISTMPNTLVMGVPLLRAMYGEFSAGLMAQIVALQVLVWTTLLLVLHEYRCAKLLVEEKFPEAAGPVKAVRVDRDDVSSLGGGEPLRADAAETAEVGKLRVTVRRSTTSAVSRDWFNPCDLGPTTPRGSSLAGAEIFSVHSSRELPSPRNSSGKDLHMFVWDSAASPTPDHVNVRDGASRVASVDIEITDPSVVVVDVFPQETVSSKDAHESIEIGEEVTYALSSRSRKEVDDGEGNSNKKRQMPSAGVVAARLIVVVVWRKLIRNPNTYATILGLAWSLIAFRLNIKMPGIVKGSITIISNTAMGMAMFSLGLFMALQPKLVACGKKWAAISMIVRFLGGPAVIAATSAAIGIRGVLLQVEIIQAALPQAIIPFVFAKEYNLHADILSTAVIFGMIVAVPITIIYYVLLVL